MIEKEDPLSLGIVKFINYDYRLSPNIRRNAVPGAVVGLLERNEAAEADSAPLVAHESSCLYHHELMQGAGFRQPPILILSNGSWLRQAIRILYVTDIGRSHPDELRLFMAVHFVPDENGDTHAHWVKESQPMVEELACQLLVEKGLSCCYLDQDASGMPRPSVRTITPP